MNTSLFAALVLSLSRCSADAPGKEIQEARTLYELGSNHLKAGRLAEAESAFSAAARLFEDGLLPDNGQACASQAGPFELAAALNNLGSTLANRHELARALPVLRRAHHLMDDPKHPQAATVAGNLATVHLELGEFAAAEPLVDFALRESELLRTPYQPYALTLRSHIRLWRGRLDQALSDLDRGLSLPALEPDLAASMHHLRGVILERQGRVSDAVQEFEAAVRLSPDSRYRAGLAAARKKYHRRSKRQ